MQKPRALSSVSNHVNQIRSSSIRMLPYWIAAALTAAVAILYAKLFGLSEEFAFSWFESYPALVFVATPAAMMMSWGIVYLFSPYANGSGIPQLLAAVEISRTNNPLLDKLLEARMIFVKFFGSCLCIVGGGVIGREGPMLQISAGIFNWVYRVWPDAKSKPNMQSVILAGGAAGLASAFNTPLGGVIFAIEELAKVHISHIRTYVFHSVIIAGLLAQAVLGNYLYFGKIQIFGSSVQEFFPLILASALIGIMGAISGSVMVMLLDFRSRLRTGQKVLMTIGCGLIVATITYFYGRSAMGGGRHVIVDLLTHPEPGHFALGFVRALQNIFTYCGGVVGGVFAPALATGAALGSWISGLTPFQHYHLWALAGMVAFLTGLTRTPFTSLILVLEMTDTHDVIIYLMVAAVIAQSAAKFIDPLSFYEHMAYRILHGKAPPKGIDLHGDQGASPTEAPSH